MSSSKPQLSSDDRVCETVIGAREEPIPEKTKSEMMEENKAQLATAFGDEDLSNLSISSRRQRRSAYTSIDELLSTEFESNILKETGIESNPSVSCVPEGRSTEINSHNDDFSFDEKYKMVLRECVPQQSQMHPRKEITQASAIGSKHKKLSINKSLKNMHKSEASRKMLQRSISGQLRSLQIENQARCVFSLGKHLYSNTLNGKQRVAIGKGPVKPLASPLVRSFRKLQECSVYNRAALLAGKQYHLAAQENCFDICSRQPDQSASSYLAFFEEDVLVNFTIGQQGSQFSLRTIQVLIANSLPEDMKKSKVFELSSLLGLLRETHGGETRLGDLLRLVQIKVKNQSFKSFSRGTHSPSGQAIQL